MAPHAEHGLRIVVALGGSADVHRRDVVRAVPALARIAARNELVLTHGNGPHVGLLLLEAEDALDVRPYPLGVAGAESQGVIGYLLLQEIERALPGRTVATVLTQVVVDPDDPAFRAPSQPIGPLYSAGEAQLLARLRGCTVEPDGPGFRRVVAAPEPRRIVELEAIETLLGVGAVVVCAGGGGVPVVEGDDGYLGVEAVVDGDLTASLLAEQLAADLLVLLTDGSHVDAGLMGPKVDAACRFSERTGGRAAIGSLDEIDDVLAGRSGTQVVAGAPVPA